MSLIRIAAASIAAVAAASAVAIDGPLPLSWRWSAKTTYTPTAKPVIDNGMIYVPVGRRVYALDAATGAQKWMFPPGEEPNGEFRVSVVTTPDTVIAANTNNFVYAINKADGTTKWSFAMGPVTARAMLLGEGSVYIFTSDDRIVALDAAAGTKAWSNDYSIGGNLIGQPAYVDGNLIYFLSNGQLTGLGAATSQQAWQTRVESVNQMGGPVSFGQSIYVVSGSQVAQMNPKTGRAGWVATFPERLAGGAAVTDKGGVVVTENGNVYTFSLLGRVTSREPIKLNGYVAGSPQAVGNNVLIRMRGGALVLLDPTRNNGEVIWEYTTQPIPGTMRKDSAGKEVPAEAVTVLGPVAVQGNSMYALAEDGSLFAWGGQFGVDEIGPSIELAYPAQGLRTWGRPDQDYYFKVEDLQTGVMSKSITVTMNGQPMKYEYKPGMNALYVKIRQPGSQEPGANPPLTDGRKTFTISAADWAGNISERTFTFVIDNTLFERPPPTGNQGGRNPGGGNSGGGRGGGGRGGGGGAGIG